MSSSFIGSKIAIITKSQCRYVGTIIGIDAQASSILLGNVKCFGTENRAGNFSNVSMVGTIVPIMQFANSDIEDLKIVDEEQTAENQSKLQPVQPTLFPSSSVSSPPLPPPPPSSAAVSQKQLSIHDDPAVVSAVISSSNKDLPMSSRLINDLHQLKLSDAQSKPEESRLLTDSGEIGQPWSFLSSSKLDNTKSSSQQQQQQQPQQSGSKSKFFDDFAKNTNEPLQSNRFQQQRWQPNTNSTQQTSRRQDFYNNEKNDESELPVRQPFFSNDRPFPQQQYQQNRYQNGNMQYQQRYFHNNRHMPRNNQQRRGGDSNRETFNDNGNSYDDEFDFESNNRKFNKLASEDEFKEQVELPDPVLLSKHDSDSAEYQPIYDKKKSFFDSIASEDASNVSGPMYNRSRNQDTFGNDRNQRQRYRGNTGGSSGGYRRSNYNNYRQQQGNDDFYYRQNNNGYQYRN